MDLEHLSKAQIILLTLLVSFVTSIATGIVTVSLMEQAPPAIAQTVNRVVERTVEKVVPSSQAAAVVTTEKTVVVKESDLIAKAVADVEPSVVRLYAEELGTDGKPKDVFLGLGVVLSDGGTIVSDSLPIDPAIGAYAMLSGGIRVRVSVLSKNAEVGTLLLQGATSTANGPVSWKPIALSGGSVLGESVVAISGRTVSRIADGIVTSVPSQEVPILDTSVSASVLMPGSPLINVNGLLVGLSTTVSRKAGESAFIPVADLMPKAEPAPKDKQESAGGSQ